MSVILLVACVPTALTGVVQSASDLLLIRMFIGIGGSTFVMCQYWTSRMFTREVVGTVNALAGGWGNLGGGVTQLVVGSALFPLFKSIYSDDDDCIPGAITTVGACASEKSWRMVCIIPAIVTAITAIWILSHSDDAPKGNYYEMKQHGAMPTICAASSFRDVRTTSTRGYSSCSTRAASVWS